MTWKQLINRQVFSPKIRMDLLMRRQHCGWDYRSNFSD